VSAATRISLDLDPTISPEELASAWRRIQAAVLKKHQRPGEKQSALAAFAHTHRDGTWRERMDAWNLEYGDRGWGYRLETTSRGTRSVTSVACSTRSMPGFGDCSLAGRF
jgi:hypothetical protein